MLNNLFRTLTIWMRSCFHYAKFELNRSIVNLHIQFTEHSLFINIYYFLNMRLLLLLLFYFLNFDLIIKGIEIAPPNKYCDFEKYSGISVFGLSAFPVEN